MFLNTTQTVHMALEKAISATGLRLKYHAAPQRVGAGHAGRQSAARLQFIPAFQSLRTLLSIPDVYPRFIVNKNEDSEIRFD